MIDFIIKNKEWLFSGIGVTVITVIFFLVRHAIVGRNNKQIKTSDHILKHTSSLEKDNSGYSIHPTPKEIADEIDSLPPYQQVEAEKNYIGLKVKWDVSLSLVHHRDDNEVILSCTTKGYSRYVKFKSSLEKYPEIKIAKEGQKITVYGAIERISPDGSGFDIDAHNLELK